MTTAELKLIKDAVALSIWLAEIIQRAVSGGMTEEEAEEKWQSVAMRRKELMGELDGL